jgi:hypothetical protein
MRAPGWLQALIVAALVAGLAGEPAAQPGTSPFESARAAFEEGDFARAAELAGLALAGELAGADRAEAWRVRGLALFYAGRRTEAAPALFEYLKHDVDARLDPAFHTAEAIAFFEQVRIDRAGELERYRREPDRRRLVIAMLPPLAQFQNREPVKGWVIVGLGGSLLVANATALVLMSRWCNVFGDGTCDEGRNGDARTARRVIMVTGWALGGVAVLGIIDGLRGYNRWRYQQSSVDTMSFGIAPEPGGATAQLRWRF